MKVMKFGGTSVGSVNSILSVKRIVESANEPVIVVVSALGGITDKLINTSKMAAVGDSAYEGEFREIVYRHVEMIKEVIPAGEKQVSLQRQIGELLNELKDIFQGIYLIKDLSPKTSDTIVSYGERLSSIIVTALIEGAKWFDSRTFIKTERKHSKHTLDTELTNKLVKEAFQSIPKVALVPGFISSDKTTGDVTNLGRGGSDYTAAIIAAALDAASLEIWTDVDGFMTADPRVISTAYTITELSYVEATELCNFGAKVVYPPTIYPVCHKNIPIIIKNTFNPDGVGTVIKQEVSNPQSKAIKGISSINDTSLITVQGLGMVGVIGVNYRIFKALAKNGISVFLVSQASSENSTSIGVRNADADLACEVLNEEFAKEIEMGEISPILAERNLATVAIVGENMKHTPGIAGKLFGTLGRNGINVIACAQGASETNISFVVDSKSLRKSLNVIHDSFFLSEYQVLNLFICGVGTVGGSLVEQIRCQQQKLMMENGLKLHVVGIIDAAKAMFSREGFDLANFREELLEKGKDSSLQTIRDEIIGMNIFNSVFVDCTASADIASLYKDFLQHNISVVAANKIAASSAYENYRELKTIARQRGVKYLFETNVGAGLPIINTINDLIHSGDKILKIEAVLSGTLNYIFNKISADIPFSRTIKMAQEERYSEPDPRIDLSGKDVIRKLVILAREAGYRLEQEDVEKNLFVPNDFFEGSLEDFWKRVPSLDADFEARRQVLEKENKHWRFVAKLENGKASVGLQEVGANHPFYGLEGSNNIILLTTERYKEYPMMIQGYGAGAGVTAAGVFADIMSCVEGDILKNHSSGHISTEEADVLIQYLQEKLGNDRVRFHTGVQYRHLLVIKGGNKELDCTPPHDVPLKPFRPLMVKPLVPEAQETADLINDLILKSQELLKDHPLNLKRMAEGKDPANSIWPWSPGYRPQMPTFSETFPQVKKGAVISAVDLINGIGYYADLRRIAVEGATGLYNTNYENKVTAALEALKTDDFVYLHIEASDEAGHEGDIDLKLLTIENLDKRAVGPIYEAVKDWDEPVAIAVLPDHPTPCELRTHTSDPIPFLIWYPGIESDEVQTYDEIAACNGSYGLLKEDEFIKEFMK